VLTADGAVSAEVATLVLAGTALQAAAAVLARADGRALQAASLYTKQAKRDEHLRSKDFFDVENHPQVRFISESAEPDGDTLRVQGQLEAAGRSIPLVFDATVREVDGELEIEAVTEADHRELGMTWSLLGIMRAPSKLIVRGRLVRR